MLEVNGAIISCAKREVEISGREINLVHAVFVGFEYRKRPFFSSL